MEQRKLGVLATNKYTKLLSFICIVSNLSYYPALQSSTMRFLVIGLWAVLALSVFLRKRVFINNNYFFNNYFLLYAVFIFNSLVSFFAGNSEVWQNHFFLPVTMAYALFLISYQLGQDVSRDDLKKVVLVYAYGMGVISVPLFFVYLSNTDLLTAVYVYDNLKNELSVLLCSSVIILCTVSEEKNLLGKILKIGFIISLVLNMIMLRARSMMLGLFFLIFVLLVKNRGIHKSVKYTAILIVAVVAVYFATHLETFDYVSNNILFAGRDISDPDNFSSGRVTQITSGLTTFYEHFFVGVGLRKTLDCMYISVLANYGILGWPLLVMACIPAFWGVKNARNGDTLDICFMVISVSLTLMSFFEELAPFGPGTRCYILWLMFGILLANKYMKLNNTFLKREPGGQP